MITIETILKAEPLTTSPSWDYQNVIKENKYKIFIYDYPINPIFKDDFEFKLCSHFYLRELAFQNIGQFCYYLSEELNNIFPYFNKVLEDIIKYDELLKNVGFKENIERIYTKNRIKTEDDTQNQKIENKSNNNQNINENGINIDKDFPVSAIENSKDYETSSNNTEKKTVNTEVNTSNSNQDSIFKNNLNEEEKYTENESRINNNTDMLYYDLLKKYTYEIDDIYNIIFKKLDSLFLSTL